MQKRCGTDMSNEQSIGKARRDFKATFLSAARRLGCKGNGGVWEWCDQSCGHRIIARVRCARGGCVFPFLLIKTALVRLLHVISGLVLGAKIPKSLADCYSVVL